MRCSKCGGAQLCAKCEQCLTCVSSYGHFCEECALFGDLRNFSSPPAPNTSYAFSSGQPNGQETDCPATASSSSTFNATVGSNRRPPAISAALIARIWDKQSSPVSDQSNPTLAGASGSPASSNSSCGNHVAPRRDQDAFSTCGNCGQMTETHDQRLVCGKHVPCGDCMRSGINFCIKCFRYPANDNRPLRPTVGEYENRAPKEFMTNTWRSRTTLAPGQATSAQPRGASGTNSESPNSMHEEGLHSWPPVSASAASPTQLWPTSPRQTNMIICSSCSTQFDEARCIRCYPCFSNMCPDCYGKHNCPRAAWGQSDTSGLVTSSEGALTIQEGCSFASNGPEEPPKTSSAPPDGTRLNRQIGAQSRQMDGRLLLPHLPLLRQPLPRQPVPTQLLQQHNHQSAPPPVNQQSAPPPVNQHSAPPPVNQQSAPSHSLPHQNSQLPQTQRNQRHHRNQPPNQQQRSSQRQQSRPAHRQHNGNRLRGRHPQPQQPVQPHVMLGVPIDAKVAVLPLDRRSTARPMPPARGIWNMNNGVNGMAGDGMGRGRARAGCECGVIGCNGCFVLARPVVMPVQRRLLEPNAAGVSQRSSPSSSSSGGAARLSPVLEQRLQMRLARLGAMRNDVNARHQERANDVRQFFANLRTVLDHNEERLCNVVEATRLARIANLDVQERHLRIEAVLGFQNSPPAEDAAFSLWEDSEIDFVQPPGPTAQDALSHAIAQLQIYTSPYVPYCKMTLPQVTNVGNGSLCVFCIHLKDHMMNPINLRVVGSAAPDLRVTAIVIGANGKPTQELMIGSVNKVESTTGQYQVSIFPPSRTCEMLISCSLRGQPLPDTPLRWVYEVSCEYERIEPALPEMILGGPRASNAPGQFNRPWGIACDNEGYLVISDRANGRIQILRPDGNVERIFGQEGVADCELSKPAGVAIHPRTRCIYVVDKDNHRIVVFSWTGEYRFRWGKRGTGHGEFFYPWDLAINPTGERVVVTDSRNHRLQFFTSDGHYLCDYQMEAVEVPTGPLPQPPPPPTRLLDQPRGVTFLDTNVIAVTDFQLHRLVMLRFDVHPPQLIYIGGEGIELGRFVRPQCVTKDYEGNLLVTESRHGRVQVLNSRCHPLHVFGSNGAEVGQFNRPAGICYTPHRRLAIVDSENHRVVIYKLD